MGWLGIVLGTTAAVLIVGPVALYFSPRWVKRHLILRLFASFGSSSPPQERPTYAGSVLPHGPLLKIETNVWCVQGTLPQPGPKFNRNMTIYRVPNSRKLVVHSAVCLNPEAKAQVEALGDICVVIVPNPYHRLDVIQYHEAYPNATFACPKDMIEKLDGWVPNVKAIEEVIEADGDLGMLYKEPVGAADKHIELIYLLKVESAEARWCLICTDLYFNIETKDADFITKAIGSSGAFGPTLLGRTLASDLAAFRAWTASLASSESTNVISSIIVGHGSIIQGVEQVQKKLAQAVELMQ